MARRRPHSRHGRRSASSRPGRPRRGRSSISERRERPSAAATRALVAMAEAALGEVALRAGAAARRGSDKRWSGRSLRAGKPGCPRPSSSCSALLARQAKAGGWGWAKGVAPDSNDTAAAVQALRRPASPARRCGARSATCAGARQGRRVRPRARTGVRCTVDRLGDPGLRCRESTRTQGRVRVPSSELRRKDGSYRFSRRYFTTPVWVTAQVLPAVLRRPFPLR